MRFGAPFYHYHVRNTQLSHARNVMWELPLVSALTKKYSCFTVPNLQMFREVAELANEVDDDNRLRLPLVNDGVFEGTIGSSS